MIKNSIFIILATILLISCGDNTNKGTVNISGSFPALAGEKLYLEEMEVRNTIVLDSFLLPNDGSFDFYINLTDAGFYVLRTTKKNNIILQVEKGETVHVQCPSKNLAKEYSVEGSPGTILYRSFEVFMESQKTRIDSLGTVYYEIRGTEKFLETKAVLDSMYEDILRDQKKYITDFISEHPNSLVSLIVLNRKLGKAEVIDVEKDFQLFHTTDSLLSLTYPNNKHVLDHQKRTKEIRLRIFDYYQAERKVIPGKKAPDIVLNDTATNPHSLKSFMGKKVIVYFWAGWDGQSRMDNRKILKLYNELKLQNTEIIGVSLDENEVVWKGAVKLDNLPWLNLSKLDGFRSEVKKSYNVPDELPFYYLLDENHIIVGKSPKLEEILKMNNPSGK